MTSNDIRILATDEQAFKVYVITKLEGLDGRVNALEAGQKDLRSELRELRAEQKDLRAEVKVLSENQQVLSEQLARIDSKADMTLWVIGIGFALMTVVLGVIGLLPTLWAGRKNEASPKPEPTSYRDIRDIVRTELELLGIRKG